MGPVDKEGTDGMSVDEQEGKHYPVGQEHGQEVHALVTIRNTFSISNNLI